MNAALPALGLALLIVAGVFAAASFFIALDKLLHRDRKEKR